MRRDGVQRDVPAVLTRLAWMRQEHIWPNGIRYLWTDAFGVVLLLSLFRELGEERYLAEAEWLVAEVDRVLGRQRGLRIGEEPDREGQYFHYLAMWIYALGCLGSVKAEYQGRAVDLAKTIHPRFVVPGVGVVWKMREDLSAPYPGFGLGALDPFHGYVVYRLLDPEALANEIADMRVIVEKSYRSLTITQDLGLGMMLWLTHFFPSEPWADLQGPRALATLDDAWVEPPGYFRRQPELPDVRIAFTNYGVALGLQAVDAWPERVRHLIAYFDRYRSGDEYDTNAITHVMACTARLPGEWLSRH